MKHVFLFLFCVVSGWAQGRYPIQIFFEPSQPESGQDFKMYFSITERAHPETDASPYFKGLSEGSIQFKSKTKGVVKDHFFRNIPVIQYSYQVSAQEPGEYPLDVFWDFDGKQNKLRPTRLAVRRNLDESGLEVSVSGAPDTLYVGEQFRLDLGFGAFDNFMSGPNLSKVDLGLEFLGSLSDESVGWKPSKNPRYKYSFVQRAYLAPLRAGNLEIPPQTIDYVKRGRPEEKVVKKQFGNSSFTSRTIVAEPIESKVKTRGKRIVVIPTPLKQRPLLYKEMVGDYNWSVTRATNSLENGEPLMVQFVVEGNGKPGLIAEPHWELPKLWNQGEPDVKTSTRIHKGRLWTTKSWTYYLYPTRSGSLDAGKLEFTYFQPDSMKYIVLNQDLGLISVTGVNPVEQAQNENADQLNAQITPSKIVSKPQNWRTKKLKIPYRPQLLSSFIVCLSLVLLVNYKKWMPGYDRPGAKWIRSLKKAFKKLPNQGSVAEIESIINDFLSQQSGLDAASHSRDQILTRLNHWNDSDRMDLNHWETSWNQKFYSHSPSPIHLEANFEKLIGLIKEYSYA